jgi:Fic-DOC domain mobile mystery protein B
VSDVFDEPDDATPLTPEERDALLQSWITHRRNLNEAEADNILAATLWARRRRGRRPADLLTDAFIRTLHRAMFGKVWRWAGTYRTSERNIGVEAYRVPVEVAVLAGDARYWVEHATYAPDELAVRFHYRLVAIHPFPNGNGRHARLLADLLVMRLGGEPFSWGSGGIAETGDLRSRYIAAVRAADRNDIGPLLAFARD